MTFDVIGARTSEGRVPFLSGTSFQFESNHTLHFNLEGTPNHPGVIGWSKDILAPGYSLPGEALPTCILTITDSNGEAIPNFFDRFYPTVFLVADDLGGRLIIGHNPILGRLVITPQSPTTFLISGTLPSTPVWAKLRIALTNRKSYDIPLWPIGCPCFLIGNTPDIIGGSYRDTPLTSTVFLAPYLSDRGPDQVTGYNSGLVPDIGSLKPVGDSSSFIMLPQTHRERFDAGVLKQGNSIRSYMRPVVSPNRYEVYFNSTRGFVSPIVQGYPLSMDLVTTAPILSLQGTQISNAFSSSLQTYPLETSGGSVISGLNTHGWLARLPIGLTSTGDFISDFTFCNLRVSGTPFNPGTRSTTLTIEALSYSGAPTNAPLNIGDPSNPVEGDLGIVACDATNSSYAWILDPATNPLGSFFFTLRDTQGVGHIETPATLSVSQTNLPALPPINQPMPISVVIYRNHVWIPYTEMATEYGTLPVSINTTPITIVNTPLVATGFHQPQLMLLTQPMAPMVVSGSPISTPLPA